MVTQENKRLLVFIFCVLIFGASFFLYLFGFWNNDWIHAKNATHIYQRGINTDCQRIIDAPKVLKCSSWSEFDSSWFDGSFGTLVEPDIGWSIARFLALFTFMAPLLYVFVSIIVCCSPEAEKALLEGKYLRITGGIAGVTVILNLLLMLMIAFWKRIVVDPVFHDTPPDVEVGIGFAFVQFCVIGFGLYLFGLFLLLAPTIQPLLKMCPCLGSSHQPIPQVQPSAPPEHLGFR